jgi:hypothetical protein
MIDSSNSSVPGVNNSSKNNIHSRSDSITRIIGKSGDANNNWDAIIRGNTKTSKRMPATAGTPTTAGTPQSVETPLAKGP